LSKPQILDFYFERLLKLQGRNAIYILYDLDPSAKAIDSVNTVVNNNGVLTGSNTDFEAVLSLLRYSPIGLGSKVLVRGSGGMAKAVVAAFKEAGFENLTVTSRNKDAGSSLATKYGYAFEKDALANAGFDVLVNVTPIGMTGGNESELAFSAELIAAASSVFDVVATPAETPLIAEARSQGKHLLTGAQVHALQAALQFEKYTGVKLSPEQIARAAEFSRS
jgi:shikimate dehydrogenase